MTIRLVGTAATGTANTSGGSATLETSVVGSYIGGDLMVVSLTWSSTNPATEPVFSLFPFGITSFTRAGNVQTFSTRGSAVYYAFIPNGRTNLAPNTLQWAVAATATGALAVVTIWRGVDPTTPLDVTPVETAFTGSAATSGNITGATTTTDGAVVVTSICGTSDGTGALTGLSAFDATFAGTDETVINAGTAAGSDFSLAVTSKAMPTAGASGTVGWTQPVALALVSGHAIALRPDPSPPDAEQFFVSRSADAGVNNSSGGQTLVATLPPSTAGALDPITAADMVVVAMFASDGGLTGLFAAPPSPWVPLLEQNGTTNVWQIYAAPYDPALVMPSFTTTQTTDRMGCMTIILRDVDPNTPLDVAAITVWGSASTTATFPAVTPTTDDCHLVRICYTLDDVARPNAAPSAGTVIVFADPGDLTATTQGLDSSQQWNYDRLSGGAGISTGTSTVALQSSIGWSAVTLALRNAPTIKDLAISATGEGVATMDPDAVANLSVFFEGSVVGEGTASATFATGRKGRRRRPRRQYIWVKDLAGNKVGVIR